MRSQTTETLSANGLHGLTFWGWQRLRLRFRALVLWEGVKAGAFWVLLLAIAAYLAAAGFAWVAALLLAIWLFFALPTLAIQAAIFADLFNYTFTRRVYLLRTFERLRKEQVESQEMALARIRVTQPGLYWYLRGASAASNTSPLTPLSLWAMLVLLRLPSKAHSPEDEPTSVLFLTRRLKDAETFLVERVVQRRGVGTG
jgi:hypothetical protein